MAKATLLDARFKETVQSCGVSTARHRQNPEIWPNLQKKSLKWKKKFILLTFQK